MDYVASTVLGPPAQVERANHKDLDLAEELYEQSRLPTDARRLIVYCAGWGTDDAVIQHLQIPANTDVLVCWDYRDLLSSYPRREVQDKASWEHTQQRSDLSCHRLNFLFQDYAECHLVAWSMGVWAAEQVLADWSWRSACAINGTPYPKHAQWGIDPEVFDATLAGLDAAGRHKFERRMCGSAGQLQAYQALSARPLEEIRAELEEINASLEQNSQVSKINWTQAIISEQDRIVPTVHQLAYWQLHGVPIKLVAGAHYLWDGFNAWEQICRI